MLEQEAREEIKKYNKELEKARLLDRADKLDKLRGRIYGLAASSNSETDNNVIVCLHSLLDAIQGLVIENLDSRERIEKLENKVL